MSFTVPLDGCTIVATAFIVTPFSSLADSPDSAGPLCCGSDCVAMSCVGGFFLMVLTILSGTVWKPIAGIFPASFRRQVALLRGCMRRDVVLWWKFQS